MPQQLIYTSAPRGLVAGRSGYCTVCRSASMRDALALRLEQLSYYHHLSPGGGKQRPIYAYRLVDIRGSRFHVLSRIQDAGLDFTGRTNFIAHHLVLAPQELAQFPTPPLISRDWPGWIRSWSKEPQLLEKEDWAGLAALAGITNVPARTWRQVTGDAINGYGLLEARAGSYFRTDDLADEIVLSLFAESVELLEMVDSRKDFRAAAWQYTFTTSLQDQDNPADFRWRGLHADGPMCGNVARSDCRPLSLVRASGCTDEKAAFARDGRQPPRFVVEPQDARITEGDVARFLAKAEGVPAPNYEWFLVKAGSGEALAGENNSEMTFQNPLIGVSRYIVRASNSAGEATSRVATLSVEPKPRLVMGLGAGTRLSLVSAPVHQKSEQEIGGQLRRIEAERARRIYESSRLRNRILIAAFVVLALGLIALTRRDVADATLAKFRESAPAKSAQEHPVMQTPEEAVPPGWMAKVIGSNADRSVSFDQADGKFILSTTAKGFSTNGDNVFFVYKTVNWKTNQETMFEAVFQPTNLTGTVGIMIRESEKPQSRFWFIGVSPQYITAAARNADGAFAMNENLDPAKPIVLKFCKEEDKLVASYKFQSTANQPTEQPVTLPDIGGGYAIAKDEKVLVGFALFSRGSTNRVRGQLTTTNL